MASLTCIWHVMLFWKRLATSPSWLTNLAHFSVQKMARSNVVRAKEMTVSSSDTVSKWIQHLGAAIFKQRHGRLSDFLIGQIIERETQLRYAVGFWRKMIVSLCGFHAKFSILLIKSYIACRNAAPVITSVMSFSIFTLLSKSKNTSSCGVFYGVKR